MDFNPYKRFYDVIRKIPPGRVATYGQVARLAGMPAHARQVGYGLSHAKDYALPWHRVVNAKGEISRRGAPGAKEKQQTLLEKERVEFSPQGRINLSRYQWHVGRE